MSQSPQKRDASSKAPQSTAVLLIGDIADTTWRMFVPAVGFSLLGVWADKQFGTKPWLLVLGIVIGVTIAGLLVVRQLKKINHGDGK